MQEIQAERDRKLEAAREQRKNRRQSIRTPVLPRTPFLDNLRFADNP